MTCLQNALLVKHLLLPCRATKLGYDKYGQSGKNANFPVCSASESSYQDKLARRQLLAAGPIFAPWLFLSSQTSWSFAAEAKKGFLPVTDKKDGYSFLFPFGWQEVVIEGQDKVFKDVIEPLESVSVNVIPTTKKDIREFGSPEEVANVLIEKVLVPPSQKAKLIQASEHNADDKVYYTFEFVAQAPNFTRHALTSVCIGNGKFYTLTTGANERRWGKMKDRLATVVDSFQIFNVNLIHSLAVTLSKCTSESTSYGGVVPQYLEVVIEGLMKLISGHEYFIAALQIHMNQNQKLQLPREYAALKAIEGNGLVDWR